MNRTLDPITASESELRAWLAAQPCPECVDGKVNCVGPACRARHGCEACQDASGKPTGLAFEWASEPCHPCQGSGQQEARDFSITHIACNGSGRVPKALTLNDLVQVNPDLVAVAVIRESTAAKPDYTLAALRTVAKAAAEQ